MDLNITINKLVGKTIRQFRLEKKINQQELANSIGVVRASLSNIETGRHQINLSTLYKLAQVLNIDVRDILPGPREITDYLETTDTDAKLKSSVNEESFHLISDIIKNTYSHAN